MHGMQSNYGERRKYAAQALASVFDQKTALIGVIGLAMSDCEFATRSGRVGLRRCWVLTWTPPSPRRGPRRELPTSTFPTNASRALIASGQLTRDDGFQSFIRAGRSFDLRAHAATAHLDPDLSFIPKSLMFDLYAPNLAFRLR